MDGSVTYIVVFIIVGVGIFIMVKVKIKNKKKIIWKKNCLQVKVHQCKTWYNNRPTTVDSVEANQRTDTNSNMTRPDELSVDIGDLSKKCDRGGLPTYEEVLAMSRQENSVVVNSVSR